MTLLPLFSQQLAQPNLGGLVSMTEGMEMKATSAGRVAPIQHTPTGTVESRTIQTMKTALRSIAGEMEPGMMPPATVNFHISAGNDEPF